MIVELEIYEDDEGLTSYSGSVDDAVLTKLLEGTYDKPFLKLEDVFWHYTKKPRHDWEVEEKVLLQYGQGEYANYQQCLYVRVERIIYIHPLKAVAKRNGQL